MSSTSLITDVGRRAESTSGKTSCCSHTETRLPSITVIKALRYLGAAQ